MKLSFLLTSIAISSLLSLPLSANDKELSKKTILTYEKLSKSFNCKSVTAFSTIKDIEKNKDIILVDIREKEEQQVSMLPGAITKEEFLKNLDKYKDKKIITYCTIGYRSGKFAEKYSKLNIYNLEGGVLAWSHFKGKFFKDNKETKLVHVFSQEWDFLNSNYKAVYK